MTQHLPKIGIIVTKPVQNVCYYPLSPRTTVHAQQQWRLNEESAKAMRRLIKTESASLQQIWRGVTVQKTVTLTAEPVRLLSIVQEEHRSSEFFTYKRKIGIEKDTTRKPRDVVLPEGTVLSVCDGKSEVMAIVLNYKQGLATGLLRFRTGGFVNFAPYPATI